MKFNNKWDVLLDKEANNRQRKRRLSLYRWEGVYDQLGIFGEMAHVRRGGWAQGKSRMKETEKWKRRQWTGYEVTVLVLGVHVLSCVRLVPCVCVLLAQSCLILCNPMDSSPPGSSVHGIFQARMLEWIAISSSRGSSPTWDWTVSPALAGWFFTTEPPGNSTGLRRGSYKYCLFFARLGEVGGGCARRLLCVERKMWSNEKAQSWAEKDYKIRDSIHVKAITSCIGRQGAGSASALSQWVREEPRQPSGGTNWAPESTGGHAIA